MQTFKFAKDIAKFTDLRIIAIVGGDPIEAQFEALASRPDIIIATPGRLMHHLREISTFKLKHVEYLVFDEADRLFEMGVRIYILCCSNFDSYICMRSRSILEVTCISPCSFLP
jgi:superfamily II DNA/RNA helicase